LTLQNSHQGASDGWFPDIKVSCGWPFPLNRRFIAVKTLSNFAIRAIDNLVVIETRTKNLPFKRVKAKDMHYKFFRVSFMYPLWSGCLGRIAAKFFGQI
jgi:hypothetical protein